MVLASLNANPWTEPKSFLRAATEFGILSYLVLFGTRVWARVVAAVFTAGVLAMNLYLMIWVESAHVTGLS